MGNCPNKAIDTQKKKERKRNLDRNIRNANTTKRKFYHGSHLGLHRNKKRFKLQLEKFFYNLNTVFTISDRLDALSQNFQCIERSSGREKKEKDEEKKNNT